MVVSGFTIVRNAIRYDYPVVESILSVLPLVDEFIVLVGNSDDGTRELIESIWSEKIKIFDSIWDDSLREGGRVLAVETDKAQQLIRKDADWAIYIQADELMHQDDFPAIKDAMTKWLNSKEVDGLLFDYTHFYGDYQFVADSRKWYRNEIRIIRPHTGIQSWKDAQGFRKQGQKLKVKKANARIFHYGWVKPPEKQQAKQENFHKMWHDDAWLDQHVPKVEEFDYSAIDSVARFTGTHPLVMQARVENQNWEVKIDPSKKRLSPRYKLLMAIEKLTGWRPGEYRNFQLLDD